MKEIIIRVPKFRRPPKRVVLAVSAALVVLAAGGVTYYLWPDARQHTPTAGGAYSVENNLPVEEPKYRMLAPAGKTIEELGGVMRVSPPDKEPAFAFTDLVGGVSISVTQQPLPPAFKENTAGELAKLAEGFGASEKISADNLTAYLGTAKSGQQSVILAKGDLLILIKSASKITTADWTTYINSLK